MNVQVILPERGADVVILLDGTIVVKERRLRAGHDVKVVGRARVLKVVDDGGKDGGEYLQVREPVLVFFQVNVKQQNELMLY